MLRSSDGYLYSAILSAARVTGGGPYLDDPRAPLVTNGYIQCIQRAQALMRQGLGSLAAEELRMAHRLAADDACLR